MNDSVLCADGLSVRYNGEKVNAVHNATMSLARGESVGLIGESGSGKSSLALAVMRLCDKHADISGSIVFNGTELTSLAEKEMDRLRWKRIAIVFQNGLDVLNPVLTVGEQIGECIRKHTENTKSAAKEKTIRYMGMAGLDAGWADAYPHQLSGGMRQKVLIAMALCCEPELLLVDEPTMALDSVSKGEIIQLLKSLQAEKGFTMLVISHELSVIMALTTRVLVMYSGCILEEGMTDSVLTDPLHPYTRGLIYSSPAINPFRDMWGIPGDTDKRETRQYELPRRCPFYGRCCQRTERCALECPVLTAAEGRRRVACLRGGIVTLLRGCGLSKRYTVRHGDITACQNCRISIRSGEVCALIGESGSGKSTVAQILSGMLAPDDGTVEFDGGRVRGNSATSVVGGIQIVFQDPLSSTNEHLTIRDIVSEPLDIIKDGERGSRLSLVKKALANVQLPNDNAFLDKRGFMLSGGQRQRVAVARALVMRPRLLIADEISAMLDPSTAANLLRLLKGLQNAEGFAMLYITHDLATAQKISDMVYVMHDGVMIENGPAETVFFHPREDYTKKLFAGMCSSRDK